MNRRCSRSRSDCAWNKSAQSTASTTSLTELNELTITASNGSLPPSNPSLILAISGVDLTIVGCSISCSSAPSTPVSSPCVSRYKIFLPLNGAIRCVMSSSLTFGTRPRMLKWNRLPLPKTLSTHRLPPINAHNFFEMDKPSPVPPY